MGPAFDESEHRERLARARQALRASGLDGYIAIAPEHLFYLVGFDANTHWSEQALVLTVDDDEPTLVLRDADIAAATETSWVNDVRTYHHGSEQPSELVASVVREKGLAGKSLGIDLQTYALPAGYFQRLSAALGATVRLIDASDVVGALRIAKSPAELAYVRRAAHYTQCALPILMDAIEPGVTELALAGKVEHALRVQGSDYPAMPTWLHSGPRTGLSHAMPTSRIIGKHEPVQFSFAGVARRYHVSVYHSVHLGPPSERFLALYAAAEEAQQAMVDVIRAGVPVAAAARAASQVAEARGVVDCARVRWGYGVGIGYPPAWLEPLDIIEESEDVFAPGMVFCLHAHLISPDENLGLIVGGDYLLGDEGLESLDQTGGSPERRGLLVL